MANQSAKEKKLNKAGQQSQMKLTIIEELEHGKMVSNLAYLIGRELGMDEDQLHDLIVAGFLHDIGKTELDLEPVYPRETALLVEEMNSIRQHPVKGYDILRRHGYSDSICDAVLHHHENYDGSGYPDNLEGWNISLDACILRVCDVFCALTSDRPYRSALSESAAVEMMIEDIEKYDLRVFLAFQRIVHDADGKVRAPEIQDTVRGVWKTIWN